MESTGRMLREVARLHVQLQREDVSQCNNITSTQCAILTELARSGEMTLADLGRRVGLDKGWVSRTVEGLTEEGLLHKVPGDTDRRTIRVMLSPAGEARYSALNRTLDAQAERVINQIPIEDRDCIFHALQLLQEVLQHERQIIRGATLAEGGAA